MEAVLKPDAEFAGQVNARLVREAHAGRERRLFAVNEIDGLVTLHADAVPGMCFSNEPGIYLPGKFGIRLEDCFHMTADGPKWFTVPPPSIDQPFL